MITEIYIKALLVDEERADQVLGGLECRAAYRRSGGVRVVVYISRFMSINGSAAIRPTKQLKWISGQRVALKSIGATQSHSY